MYIEDEKLERIVKVSLADTVGNSTEYCSFIAQYDEKWDIEKIIDVLHTYGYSKKGIGKVKSVEEINYDNGEIYHLEGVDRYGEPTKLVIIVHPIALKKI